MLVSLSAVLLLGGLVFLLWRYARLPLWQAGVCAMFGFFLASTSVGPHIANALRTFAHFLSGLHL
jgi:hypothetical protein